MSSRTVTGGLTSGLARITFLMQSNLVLQANFVTNPFTPVAGTFTGLFRKPTLPITKLRVVHTEADRLGWL